MSGPIGCPNFSDAMSDAPIAYTRPPHPRERRMIFKNVDREGWTNDIDCYLRDGGYAELRKALTSMKPQDVVGEVNLRTARARRGGLPVRREVGLHQAGRQAGLP
jgi:NADH-quinone oxidoreductase subunit F